MNKINYLVVILFVIVPILQSNAQISIAPTTGEGTNGNPYQISSLENLFWITENSSRWNLHYVQIADIDASTTALWDGKAGWRPIGNENIKFTGSYNGKGYHINSLHIERVETDYIGFFGYTEMANLDSIFISNIKYVGKNTIGGLAGYTKNTSINHCHISGEISGTSYIGGLTGYNDTGDGRIYIKDIKECSSNTVITGESYLGGLIGRTNSSISLYPRYVRNCFAISKITGNQYIGGLIGRNTNTGIYNCYTQASIVSNSSYVGGLIGNNTGKINACYASCSVIKKSSSYVGGLVGLHSGSLTLITNSFWDRDLSGLENSSGGTGKTSLEMIDIANYTDITKTGLTDAWDFVDNPYNDSGNENHWKFSLLYNNVLPYLSWQVILTIPEIKDFFVSEISNNSVNASANLYNLGTTEPVFQGFCWNTTGNPGIEDLKTPNVLALQSIDFTASITELDPITTYFIRPFASHNSGVEYGKEISFTTLPAEFLAPEGAGSPEDPYLISNLQNLHWLTNLNPQQEIHCIQTAHINASETKNWNDGKGWYPISGLEGSYNGQNYLIDSLFINRPDEDNLGLFGNSSIKIENLGMTNVDITGKNNIGSFAGYHWNGLDNCFSTGKVAGHQMVGGLIGRGSKLTSDSYKISNCYSYCDVSLTNDSGSVSLAGGLTGTTSMDMVGCYATGNITGGSSVGGLTGFHDGKIIDCYFTGNVTGEINVGGIAGNSNGNIINSFYNLDAVLINGEKIITAGALFEPEYVEWMNNNKTLDINNYLSSDGSNYLISNIQDFKHILAFGHSKLNFLLTADIDMINDPGFYIPLFTGQFNGGGYTISNLDIDRKENSNLGLFGILYSARIVDLKILNASVNGYQLAGILAGSAKDTSLIINCKTAGKVSASWEAGGLIGYQVSSLVRNSSSSGFVSGETNIGGLIGKNDSKSLVDSSFSLANVKSSWNASGGLTGLNQNNSVISSCYSSGFVTGYSRSGGLAGENNGQIKNSYAIGNVKGNDYIGGLIGYNNSSQVAYCYSIGQVSASQYAGGLAGASIPVANSFWDVDLSGISTSSSGKGKTTADLRNVSTYTQLSSGAVTTPWDFTENPFDDVNTEDIWNINPNMNFGLPFLNWQENMLPEYQIKTKSVSEVNFTFAIAYGIIMSLGEINPIQHGFCWNTTGTPGIHDFKTERGPISELKVFSDTLSGLLPNTDYFMRSYMRLSDETVYYGEEMEFKTLPVEPLTPEGTGTDQDPYQIDNLGNLLWLSMNTSEWAKYFIQTSDIDASSMSAWNNGEGWNPVGTQMNQFLGFYNGKGHIIDKLFINRPDSDYQGLFGSVSGMMGRTGGGIENLGLTNVNITGKLFTGGLAGFYTNHIQINNCLVTGTITGIDYVGGLIGDTWSIEVNNCYANGNITGNGNYTGGLIGRSTFGSIANCYSLGIVQGESFVGGLTGGTGNTILTNNYSISEVNGNLYVGGFIGSCRYTQIRNCYSAGKVSGNSNTGGFIGKNDYSLVDYCFWNTESSEQAESAGGSGKAITEMQDAGTYLSAGWDFIVETANGSQDIWAIYPDKNDNYPFFMWQGLLRLAEVGTGETTEITDSCATIHGNIKALGFPELIIQHGFCWNTSGNPGMDDDKTELGDLTELSQFSTIITGLMPGTNYYVRAYAITEAGISYGEEIIFTTLKRELFIGGSFSVINKEYDGDVSAWISKFQLYLIGVADGDLVGWIHGLSFEDEEVGTEKLVNVICLYLYGRDAHKYTVSMERSPTTTADIFPRAITIGGSFAVENKVYDGTRSAELKTNNLTLNRLVSTDEVWLTDLKMVFADSAIGNNYTVKIIEASLAGDRSHNYSLSLTGSPTSKANITGQFLTIILEGDGRVWVNKSIWISGNTTLQIIPGSEVLVEALPLEGYSFKEWSGSLISDNALDTIVMNQEMSITAKFIFTGIHHLNFSVQGEGFILLNDSAEVQVGQLSVRIGDYITLKAVPDYGYVFKEWKGDLVSEDAEVTLVYSDQSIVTAVFEKLTDVHTDSFTDFQIYPNPFTEFIHIRYENFIERMSLANILGEIIVEIPLMKEGYKQIPTSNLESGIYLVRFYKTDGSVITKKLVKN